MAVLLRKPRDMRESKDIAHVVMYPAATARLDNPAISILRDALLAQQICLTEYRPWLRNQDTNILHIHWPERTLLSGMARHFRIAARFYAQNLIASMEHVARRNGRVFWTVHNLEPHAKLDPMRKQLWDSLTSQMVPLVTDLVIMDEAIGSDVLHQFPTLKSARCHVIPLPHYRAYFDKKRSAIISAEFTKKWPNQIVLLMAGHAKPYKNIPATMHLFHSMQQENLRLVIAGKIDRNSRNEIAELAQRDDRITVIDELVSDEKMIALYDRADVALFNFTKIHNSGSVKTALSLNTPVIAPRKGLLPGIQARVSSKWINLFDRELTAAKLIEAIELLKTESKMVSPNLSYWEPDRVGLRHKAAYCDQ